MTLAEALAVLEQRRNYLRERVRAKEAVGWESVYDARERDALSYVLERAAELPPEPPC